MEFKHVAILGAMPEEIGEIVNHIHDKKEIFYGDLKVIQGTWNDVERKNKILISVAWSGWGKVSSARAATRIISSINLGKKVDILIFTGVAGAVSNTLRQWDIVIASKLIQYDMDARPFFEKFVIPAISKDHISIDEKLLKWTQSSLQTSKEKDSNLRDFGSINIGKIATGDKFISDREYLEEIKLQIPNLLAIEMEGAAVAQVAFQEKVPCVILRTISDSADEDAATSFDIFLKKYKLRSWLLIECLLKNL